MNEDDSINNIINPIWISKRIWRYRELIRQLTLRAVTIRHKGSFVGFGWNFIQPLLMLCVYTFVFSIVFKARWGVETEETRITFALTLFMGIITYNLFSETLNGAPTIILSRVNLVKKIVFPLDILPLVHFLSVLTNCLLSLAVLLAGLLIVYHSIPWTALLLPLVWLPMMMFALGCGYFVASIGVFIRDFNAIVRVITMMFFFLTPIFYPISAVPPKMQILIKLNPIAVFVENARRVVIWGMLPDWIWFFWESCFSLVVLFLGYIWFMKSKKTFVDII